MPDSRPDEFMEAAIDEALAAVAEGGLPYGAVLVRGGEIIGRGRNRARQSGDPTSHAEMEAIRDTGLLDTYTGTTMVATALPCIMCSGAIVYLKIPRVIFGAAWPSPSLPFLRSQGVRVTDADLKVCRDLLARR